MTYDLAFDLNDAEEWLGRPFYEWGSILTNTLTAELEARAPGVMLRFDGSERRWVENDHRCPVAAGWSEIYTDHGATMVCFRFATLSAYGRASYLWGRLYAEIRLTQGHGPSYYFPRTPTQ